MEVTGEISAPSALLSGKKPRHLLGMGLARPRSRCGHCREGKKGKAILVTGRGGPYGCETSRLPHFLDNRVTDGGEVISLTPRPPFTHRKIPVPISVTG
jgi:hypothetical protein